MFEGAAPEQPRQDRGRQHRRVVLALAADRVLRAAGRNQTAKPVCYGTFRMGRLARCDPGAQYREPTLRRARVPPRRLRAHLGCA